MKPDTIIFAEKPNQAKDNYAPAFDIDKKEKGYYILKPCSTFPNGAYLTWGMGHLVELKKPSEYKEEWGKWNMDNLPIFPDFKFKTKESSKHHFKLIKSLFNKDEVNTIINCCDPEREGSNIFHSTLALTGAKKNKTIKRLWINSLTKSNVQKGFNNLLDEKDDIPLYKEAQTRQYADWLIGMNLSPLFGLSLQNQGFKGVTSIGRVQSPTVYMIYQRQKEVENFVSKPFYELESVFSHEKGEYKGKAKIKTDNKSKIKELLQDHNLTDLNNNTGTIQEVDKEIKQTEPPQLFSLSTMQERANEKWKYNSANVLKIMQNLYEKKILTYPRTESVHITESEYQYLKENINDLKNILNVSFENNFEVRKKHIDGQKVQEHHAIIPTENIPSDALIERLTTEEKNIYLEVLKTTLAMFAKNYEYEETQITTNVNNIEFHTKGKVEKSIGWKALFSRNKNGGEKEHEKEINLPEVNKNDEVKSNLNIAEGHTTPPKLYTEGTIVKAMASAGKLLDDEDESKILKDVKGIGTVATRSDIIENIKNKGFIESKNNKLYVTKNGEVLCNAIEGTLLSSPSMTAKWEEYLDKIGKERGSQDVFIKQIKAFIQKMINEIPNQIKEKKFITDTISKQQKENAIAKCPSCNGAIEDKGKFFGCSGYQNGCKISFPKKWASKTLTIKNIKDLCSKKETSKIKGFKNKKGNKFPAKLTLDENYKINLNFN